MQKIKGTVYLISVLLMTWWAALSPYVVLVSSLLSAFNYYQVAGSVVSGVVGFIIGGAVSSVGALVVFGILGLIAVFTIERV